MPGAGLTHGPPATKKQAAVTTGSAETTGIPCATVLTAYTCSPRCTGLFSHRRPRERLARSWIPASGDRDHTISPSASHAARLATRIASIAPRSQRSWRLRGRPSESRGMPRDDHIFLKNGREIFFADGLDISSDYRKRFCRLADHCRKWSGVRIRANLTRSPRPRARAASGEWIAGRLWRFSDSRPTQTVPDVQSVCRRVWPL